MELSRYNGSPISLLVVDWLVAGNSKSQIRELILDHAPLCSFADCDSLIEEGKKVLEETVSTDTKQTTTINLARYEEIYKYFHFIQDTDGMNKAMKAKERLLGLLHNQKIVVNKNTTINITRQVKYNTDRLSHIEKLRLEELMQKAAPQPGQITVILPKQ